ncbi:MAG: hypothetical protein Q8K82_18655 [Gemmatimonadaceae bacterium]|nr:hypothetical protein [Gemmatimonadaceae bacterium]
MGRIHSRHGATIAVVVALVATSELRSQTVSREPNAAEVATLLRGHGHATGALAVLTQARGRQPQQKMDEIADSLVAIAVSFPGMDLRGAQTRGAAQATILLAGMGSSGIVGIDHAVPYVGAADRLMRIAETAEDVGMRGGALSGLTQLPNKTRLLPFLRHVAMSQNVVAWKAVTLLTEETGPEGRAIARELYREGRVTQPTAREMLVRAAGAYRWR